jgi:hypothetical protein
MPSRRFTIACLVTTLVGMLAAMLVADGSQPARSWEIGMVVPCVFDEGFTCAPPLRK